MKQDLITVASPPEKPLLLYDNDCNFCKFWILRWQRFTCGNVDCLASQDPSVATRFPEISSERFAESVQLVETDGMVYSGAEAVFRTLAYRRGGFLLLFAYQRLPGFRQISEWSYAFVAQRRTGFSILTRLFSGPEGALPEYRLVAWLFLRMLGIVYLCAFASLQTQVLGLIGSRGIMPAARFMQSNRQQADKLGIGLDRYRMIPTVCWVRAGDRTLRALCWAGCALSILLIANVAPVVCLFLLWVVYLSLAAVGREFLSFQWDALLLETGFLAIFFAPLRWFAWPSRSPEPSRIMLWLLRWLLFRLMFESGVVKLTSGDPVWRKLLALNYHYQTQPLPTWVGWYAHQLPPAIQQFCVAVMFVIELLVPFFIFLPRRVRLLGCWLLIFLQICILITGNYCFFNLLTIALCVLLLDDAALLKCIPSRWRRRSSPRQIQVAPDQTAGMVLPDIVVPPSPRLARRTGWRWPVWVTVPLAAVILFVSIPQICLMLRGDRATSGLSWDLNQWIGPFSTINRYGLFAVMTTVRPEIVIEGSNDGKTWLEYEFKYKPGDVKHRPAFVAPHQPRLDWQMWFAALGDYRHNLWFMEFSHRLLEGSPPVLKLLRTNPFPDAPPRMLRARLYVYEFSNFKQRREQGVWWQRELQGNYLPPISL